MDAPKPSYQTQIKNKEKVFELISNKGNYYIITLMNKQSSLFITAVLNHDINKRFYENNISLESLKENKAFAFYESIDEILSELFPLIDKGNVRIIEEMNFIRITFDLPLQKFNNISFIVNEIQKSVPDKINEFYNIIVNKNKEINELKKDQNNLRNEISDLKIRIIALEIENKEILKKIQENSVKNFDSKIINSLNEIEFIFIRLKQIEKLKDKKILLNLLFRVSRDGKYGKDFHEKCDRKQNLLVFIQSTKGRIFGGFTEVGYRSKGEYILDKNAFVFSISKKKIYNIKKGENSVSDFPERGPCFYNRKHYIIYIDENILGKEGNTCECLDCVYDGLTSDFEVNDGEKNFFVQEIEVFQINCIE